jgi:hypothetical protein
MWFRLSSTTTKEKSMSFHRIIIALCGLALAEASAMDHSIQSGSHTIGNAIFGIEPTQLVRTREFTSTGLESKVENISDSSDYGTVKILDVVSAALEKLRPYHEKNTLLVDLLKAEIGNVYSELTANITDTTTNLSGGYLISTAFDKILQNKPEVKKDLTIITDQLKNVGVTVLENGNMELDIEDAISAAIGCCGFLLRKK